jgi:hypothetical protein
MNYLYRYQPPERVTDFSATTLHFSDPKKFNDPFDLNPSLRDPTFSVFENDDHLLEVIKALMARPARVNEFALFSDDMLEALRTSADETNFSNYFITLARQHFLEMGVACLSENSNSMPMWAHYANNSAGFCIEYEIPGWWDFALANSYLYYFPVAYVSEVPTTPMEELIFSPRSAAIKVLATKHLSWAYEREIRLIAPGKQGQLQMPKTMRVNRVIAGHKMEEFTKNTLLHSCTTSNVKMWHQTMTTATGSIREERYRAAA